MCLQPDELLIDTFIDGDEKVNLDNKTSIIFSRCSNETEVECSSHEEFGDFGFKHVARLSLYERKVNVNFAAQDGYTYSEFQEIGNMQALKGYATINLQLNDLQMNDSIFNPFSSVTDEVQFMDTERFTYEPDNTWFGQL